MLLLVAIGLNTSALAAEGDDPQYDRWKDAKPVATVEIKATSVKFLVGGGWGSGTLYYKGKEYPFKMKAGRAGGIGWSKLDATGDVYFLEKLEDFPGTYGGVTSGMTGGTKSAGDAATVENSKGVAMRLRAKSTGLALSIGAGGMNIKFEDE